ncbi:MAG: type IV secretory system conjugative DNA transfer family protein [Rhodospirillales bacterium]|nr:type IV secretory system conjugative DNA transfer family protein [Rhodospirillales bacterium]
MTTKAEDLLRDIPRGVASRYLKHQSLPQARWQSPEAIMRSEALAYDPKNPDGKILVGALGDKLIGIKDDRHIVTVAGSRSGKSVTLIGNLHFYDGSIIAIDPKAELANLTANVRAGRGQRVYVLDPYGYADKSVAPLQARYNPLSVLTIDSPTIIEDAGLITDGIVVQPESSREPHWDETAKNFIESLTLHVATAPAHVDERHLVTVRRLIMQALRPDPDSGDKNPLCALERAMLENARRLQRSAPTADIGEAIEGGARDFYEKADRERDSVLSTARRHTKFLDYAALKDVVSGHDFDLSELKSDPRGVTVYLCIPATRMTISKRWLRIIINQLLDAMEREKTKPPAPVLACLDEFPVLGYMQQLEAAAGQIASFGVKLWTVLQDWGQGKALYKERWETFVANAGVLQFFGNHDVATSEYISRKLGKTMIEVSQSSEVGPEQRQAGLSGQSAQLQLHDLMTPEEISRHFARSDRLKRQIVIWAGYHPMILQRVEHFDPEGPLAPFLRHSL